MLDFVTIKDVKISVGTWCKQLRKSNNLTQQQLAIELSISPLTISKLENGENPTLETILKILQHFDEMKSFNQFVTDKKNTLLDNESMY